MADIATTCPFCGCGCGLYLHVAEGRISGVAPSRCHPVSQGRLCLKGWHAHELMDNPARLTRPFLRKDGALAPVSWEEALSAAAAGLNAALRAGGPQAVGVLGSARAANEDNYALARFARATLKTPNLDCSHRTGSLPTSGDLAALEASDLVLLVGNDPNEEHPAVSARLYRGRLNGSRLVVIATRRHALARLADVFLQARPGGEAEVIRTLLRALLADQRSEALAALKASVAQASPETAGLSAADVEGAARLLAGAKQVALLYSSSLAALPAAATARTALADLAAVGERAGAKATLLELLPRNNLRGCLDMGVSPDRLPGYASLVDSVPDLARAWGADFCRVRGLSAWEMPGKVKALYVMGDDLTRAPAAPDLTSTFLIVQDIFLSPMAQQAQVVLPAAAFAERDGTYTNQERRVQRIRQAVTPPGEAWEDWKIVAELSARLGASMPYMTAENVFAEIATVVPMYRGVSYQTLERAGGASWPADMRGPFAWQRGLQPLPRNGSGPRSSAEFPFLLLADATLGPWDQETSIANTLTVAVEFTLIGRDYPTGMLYLHPEDAKQLGVRAGRNVQVRSARGEASLKVLVSDETPRGVVLVPHWQALRLGVMEIAAGSETERPVLAPTPVAIKSA